MNPMFISATNLRFVLDELQSRYSVLVPVRDGDGLFYEVLSSTRVVIGEVRAVEPLKSFFFRAKQIVAENYSDSIPGSRNKPLCIVAAKACDLKGFRVLDAVFMGDDYVDPFYADARKRNLIISADCTTALDVCFCLAVDVKPFPDANFDINLSEVQDGYVVQVGSEKGSGVVEEYADYFQEAGAGQLKQRDEQRSRVREQVRANIRNNGVPAQERLAGAIVRNFDNLLWQEEAETCVECGACNTICPTCHCFLLSDQLSDRDLTRYRLWDSCLIKDFAQVAGGANPRQRLWMRLRNRFDKKFAFFPEAYNIYACTGCGRCIAACPGKIDIRKVLKRNVENVHE